MEPEDEGLSKEVLKGEIEKVKGENQGILQRAKKLEAEHEAMNEENGELKKKLETQEKAADKAKDKAAAAEAKLKVAMEETCVPIVVAICSKCLLLKLQDLSLTKFKSREEDKMVEYIKQNSWRYRKIELPSEEKMEEWRSGVSIIVPTALFYTYLGCWL
jgi:hypothetical protein